MANELVPDSMNQNNDIASNASVLFVALSDKHPLNSRKNEFLEYFELLAQSLNNQQCTRYLPIKMEKMYLEVNKSLNSF